MEANSPCPNAHYLQAFMLGELSGVDAQSVEDHLDHCDACRMNVQSGHTKPLVRPHQSSCLDSTDFSRRTPEPVQVGSPPPLPRVPVCEVASIPNAFPFLLPAVEPDEIGRLGTYRILRVLGTGGMGMVFEAEDIVLRRPVALKVMMPEMNNDGRARQRFLREARAMAAIKHPHFVTVFQAGQENGVPFLAMELLEGETLHDWIRQGRRSDIAELLRLAAEIASGLAVIHQHGLIHRDIKPANIWLEAPNRHVKLLDFGLARPIKDDMSMTQAGTVLGTPAFMSPEQARGTAADARSDLFSLGAVLYAMCTGAEPFTGINTLGQLTALAVDTPRPVSDVNAIIPRELSDLVAHLLAKNPNQRPASAATVIERIRSIRPAAPTPQRLLRTPMPTPVQSFESAPTKTLPTRSGRRSKRVKRATFVQRYGLTVLFVVGLVSLITLTVFGIIRLRSDSSSTSQANADDTRKDRDVPTERPEAGKYYLTDQEVLERPRPPMPPRDRPPPPDGPPDGPPRRPPDGPPPRPPEQVRVRGQVSPHGLYMHPPPAHEGASIARYRLDGKYSTFHAEVALHDDAPPLRHPVTFRVYGDNVELWTSREIRNRDERDSCKVSVKGVKELKLTVTSAGDPGGAHAVWVEPYLLK